MEGQTERSLMRGGNASPVNGSRELRIKTLGTANAVTVSGKHFFLHSVLVFSKDVRLPPFIYIYWGLD